MSYQPTIMATAQLHCCMMMMMIWYGPKKSAERYANQILHETRHLNIQRPEGMQINIYPIELTCS